MENLSIIVEREMEIEILKLVYDLLETPIDGCEKEYCHKFSCLTEQSLFLCLLVGGDIVRFVTLSLISLTSSAIIFFNFW